MLLRRLIKNAIRGRLNEYLTNDVINLKDYLSMTDEAKMAYLPHEYCHYFSDFLDETEIDFDRPDDFDDDVELVIWLEHNDIKIYNAFGKYLYDKLIDRTLRIPPSEYPAWTYFDGAPVLIKNQWLIHFTDKATDISLNGFKYGVDDMTRLGLTCHINEFDKRFGGYNFAYLLSDYIKYANNRGNGYKYGKEAVLFNASGLKVWHIGDEEPQVIFYGNTAKNIIPITGGDTETWGIRNANGRFIYENDDLPMVVNWLVKNYAQYRKSFK